MSSLKSFIRGIAAASVTAVALSFTSAPASASTKDVDLMFVIDRSGSMQRRVQYLADNVEDFFNGLAADSRVGSLAGGLVSYLGFLPWSKRSRRTWRRSSRRSGA